MAGLGIAPLGVSPYGLGTPATSSANEGAILIDAQGNAQGSRYINPRTRQYEYDSNGRAIGQSSVRSLVYMAILTVKNSSAMASLGEEPPSGVIGNNYVARRKASVTNALAQLVKDGLIEIIAIDVDIKNRPTLTRIRWRDLTTLNEASSDF